jgi:hypothetical protein
MKKVWGARTLAGVSWVAHCRFSRIFYLFHVVYISVVDPILNHCSSTHRKRLLSAEM